MARRHHYKRRNKDAPELDVTTFLNLMVVLIPFLLITVVFSRLTIVELNVPSSEGAKSLGEENFRVEVIVREAGIEITNGSATIASMPKKDDEYDLGTLSDFIVELKREHPDQDAASVLMEESIPYDYLIRVMDIVRSVEVPIEDEGRFEQVALFGEISIGDAP